MNGFTLNEEDLLKQLRQAKDIEIERLLTQYGTSLKDVREMYPQLTGAIKQRQLTTAFPTQPLFFSASEAAQMGLGLQEGWMLKMTPTAGNGGYTSSFITPQKWEITENDLYISPTGEQYSKADLEALLGVPTGGLEATPQALTIKDLTEEGQSLYQEYQESGGALDVKGWLDLRERQQLETEQVFGAVFPEQDISEVLEYMKRDPEGFLADIREIGPTEEMVRFLKMLEFEDEAGNIVHLTDEEIAEFFGMGAAPQYIPEGWAKDIFLDTLTVGWQNLKYGLNQAFTSILPALFAQFFYTPMPTSEEEAAYYGHVTPPAPYALPLITQEELKDFYESPSDNLDIFKGVPSIPMLSDKDIEMLRDLKAALNKSELRFVQLMEENDAWIVEHPELTPKPEYLADPWEHTELFKDPGYWGYSIMNSLVYTVSVMGTMVGISAIATPAAGIPAGMLVAGAPEATSMTEELVRQGVPFDEAIKWGTLYGTAAGGIETVSDLPFLGLLFKPIKAAVQPMWNTIFRGVASRIVKKVLTGVVITQTEALEEVFTQVIHNAILKHYDETQSLMEGVSHAYIQATIASTPFGAIGGYASFNTFYDRLSPQMQQQYSGLVQRFQEAGLTEQEAQVQAANELAKTTEGEAELTEAIEAAQEEYWEEHPEVKRPSIEPVIPTLPESILQDMRVADEIAKKGVPEKATGGVAGKPELTEVSRVFPESIASSPIIEGKVYRVHIENIGIPSKATAADILRFERDELGNSLEDMGVSEELLNELDNYRGSDVIWVTKKKADAEYYLSEGMTKKDISVFDLGKGSRIVADDQQGGYLVLFGDAKPIAAIPTTEAGMPEAGLQPSMLEEVPAKEVRPQPTGKLIQARIDDYLRLREYNKQATIDRIAEIKKALETKGRVALGLKGNLRLELARLEALQELDAVENIAELDRLIRQVREEIGLREMPYAGYGGKAHIDLLRSPTHRLFKGYSLRQLEEMLNVYNQARQSMQAEVPALEPTPKPEPSKEDIERVKTDPTPASDEIILQKFIECIKDAKPAREVTEVLKHQELSKRSAIFASILRGGEGSKAFEKAKSALRGFLPRSEYLLDLQEFGITDADIERMIDQIRTDNKWKPLQKLNTYEAFINLVMGGIPTEGQLLLLERQFGSELAKTILTKMSTTSEKATRIIQDIANIPRTLQTFADLSASLRQGAVLAFGQPVQFATAFKAELKVVFSEKNFILINEIIHNNVYADSAHEHGLYIAPIEEAVRIEAREEAFRGRLIEKVPIIGPIVRASERAYITMLNVLRMETYAYYCRQWEGTGKTVRDYDKLASFINHATGRGDLGAFSRGGAWLSAMFYSPRFIMSRLQVPLDLINTTPAVRKVVARNLVAFVGTGMMALVLARLGGAEVEDDPHSSDFGKVKIGNTRIDFWAGFQPYVRVITQIITEERKSTRTGETYKIDPIDVGVYFFRSKLAPMPGLLWDLKSGETFIGEELSAENAEKIIFEKLTPLFIQDLVEAVRDSGIAGVGYGTLALLGVGVQTWSDNWETAELKLGLPERGENLPYTKENAIYDVGDYYSEISRMIGGATYEMLSDKRNMPELVLSVAQAKDIVREINLLPNKRLTSINADPAEGDTFEQYRTQWLARQKITDAEELKQFDKDYSDAYLGNMTQVQYALLTEYHSLPESEKAEFLGKHPELYINPREDWLRSHPQENALLVLWDKAKIYSLEALNQVEALAKSLDIPENALILQDLDAVTQLKLKNKAISDLLDAYSGLDDEFIGPDGLTARDIAIQQLYADNPDFRDDMRRIEALNVGTEANPTLESIVEGWVERGQVVDEFGPSSAETKLWLIDNREVHQWALENGLLTDTGEDWNEAILRLDVQYRDDFDRYEDYGNKESPFYVANDTARANAREAMLFNAQGQMTSFGTAYYTIQAIQKGLKDVTIEASTRFWFDNIVRDLGSVQGLVSGKVVTDALKIFNDIGQGLFPSENERQRVIVQLFALINDIGQRTDFASKDKVMSALAEAHDFLEDLPLMKHDELMTTTVPSHVNFVTTYVDYYGIRKQEGVDYSAGWYEDDWFLMNHPDFYQAMISLGLWQSRDFSKVPTRGVYDLYKTYMTLPTGQPRLDFRAKNKALDDWLVLSKGYTPVGNR